MHTQIIDAIDYVVSVSAMSWLNKSDGSAEATLAVLRDADLVGQSIVDEYADAMASCGRTDPVPAYEWRPVYQLSIQPSLARSGIQAAAEDQSSVIARLEQLDRCRGYLVTICSRSSSWLGSPAQLHLVQVEEQLQQRLRQAEPAGEVG